MPRGGTSRQHRTVHARSCKRITGQHDSALCPRLFGPDGLWRRHAPALRLVVDDGGVTNPRSRVLEQQSMSGVGIVPPMFFAEGGIGMKGECPVRTDSLAVVVGDERKHRVARLHAAWLGHVRSTLHRDESSDGLVVGDRANAIRYFEIGMCEQ